MPVGELLHLFYRLYSSTLIILNVLISNLSSKHSQYICLLAVKKRVYTHKNVGFEVLTAVSMKTAIFTHKNVPIIWIRLFHSFISHVPSIKREKLIIKNILNVTDHMVTEQIL
jgi:hypothetical protein